MIRNISAITILCLLTFLAFNLESATKVKSSNTSGFSAENAFEYLEEIAKEPHPIGSLENKKVRDYLVQTLRAEGLEAEVQTGYVKSSWKPSYVRMAYVENVVATLKGTDPNAKKVVIACHYDSVMEGPGAADDGYAVACAIETVKLLKKENRKSDLILLITDGEEYGLFGAQLYASKTDLSEIGIMLNYEARGNEGPGIAFEWSDNNAWLVDELSKAYKRPIANSLSYEVYKRMSNGSDFTIFKRKAVPGINHAFIDGFSYYHHPQDNLQNISKESIQHTGENMYLAAKHFTNYEFKEEKKRNASFFNFYGFFVNYGADLDLIFFTLAMLLAVLIMTLYKRRDLTSTKGSLISLLGIFGTLLLSSGACFGLTFLLKKIYPQYATFYANHYYNHEWYLLAGIGLTFVICWLLGRILIKKYGSENLGVAILLLLTFLSLGLYIEAQSATYLMMYPLATISAGLLLQSKFQSEEKPWIGFTIGIITLSVLIGFWAVFSHSIYLAFSLNILFSAIIPTALFCFASYALLPDLWKKSNAVAIFGVGLFLFSLGAAHATSNPTEARPLKSNLFYTYNSENAQTSVATFDDHINEGHLGLIDENEKINLAKQMPYYNFASASDVDLSKYKSEISDSIPRDSKSSKTITLTHPKYASMTHIYIPEITNVDSLFVNNQLNKAFKDGATGGFYSPMYGFGLDTMEVRLVKRDTSVMCKVYVNIQYRDMPVPEKLPRDMVRNGGKVVMSEVLEF
jgi:hypothetical protein